MNRTQEVKKITTKVLHGEDDASLLDNQNSNVGKRVAGLQ
jgi:hypothetical protein